ncbi:hypothetical protein NFJ02_03g101700 [Pycnococcus provasolii]
MFMPTTNNNANRAAAAQAHARQNNKNAVLTHVLASYASSPWTTSAVLLVLGGILYGLREFVGGRSAAAMPRI